MALSTIAIRAILNEVKTRRGANLFDLPVSGQISAGQINEELGRPYVNEFNINGAEERALAGIPTGEISFSDFYGKSSAQKIIVGSTGLSFGWNSGVIGDMLPRIFEFTEGNFDCPRYDASSLNEECIIILVGSHATAAVSLETQLETAPNSGIYNTYVLQRSISNIDWWLVTSQPFRLQLANNIGNSLKVLMQFI